MSPRLVSEQDRLLVLTNTPDLENACMNTGEWIKTIPIYPRKNGSINQAIVING